MVMQHEGVRYALAVECPKGQTVANRLEAIQDALWECRFRCTEAERSGCATRTHLDRMETRALVVDSLMDERRDPRAVRIGGFRRED